MGEGARRGAAKGRSCKTLWPAVSGCPTCQRLPCPKGLWQPRHYAPRSLALVHLHGQRQPELCQAPRQAKGGRLELGGDLLGHILEDQGLQDHWMKYLTSVLGSCEL